MSDLARIQWHCRRGLLELDLVLQRFLDGRFNTLNAAEVDEFKALLSYEDNDLLDMVMGRAEPVNARLNDVLMLLRNV